MKKQLLMGTLAAAMTMGAMAPAMADGLGASAGVASMYLWRGLDLGNGSAAVWGDINYKAAGAYGGLWASSGDSSWGQEYDLYAGYGFEAGGLGIDLSVWNYNYSNTSPIGNGGFRNDTTGELTDVILALSFAGATFKAYEQVADGDGAGGLEGYNEYYTLSYGANGFTGLVGVFDQAAGAENYTHVDLSYAYNSNLSFTASKVTDDDGGIDDDVKFVVSYALPIL